MTANPFELADIPHGQTARCIRCDSTLIVKAWARHNARGKLEIACLPCAEAIEREDQARERSA